MDTTALPWPIVERLGWMLIHSVWQFAILAFVAMLLRCAMRHASAASRYLADVAILLLMFVSAVATWASLPAEARVAPAPPRAAWAGSAPVADAPSAPRMQPPEPSAVVPRAPEPGSTAGQSPISAGATAWWSSGREAVQSRLHEIVLFWCVGVVAFGLRPLASWRAVHRFRTVGLGEVPESVRSSLDRLVEQMGIRQSVRLCKSALVKAPAVVGCFRPMVLLPIGLVTGLSTWQVEAIIAHELAHVARRDYLVNLLQTLLETLFFYHPAVWRLSRRIREERENCCDDLAVAVLGNRVGYCRAILAASEVRDFGTALAMGAQGGALAARFRRLLDGQDVGPPGRFLMPAGAVAVAVLVGLAIGAGVWGRAPLHAAQAAAPFMRDEVRDAAAVKDQQDALAALKALGVSIYGAPPASFPGSAGWPARKVDLWNVRPEMSPYLGRLAQIEELGLVGGDLRGEPFVQLGRLTNLRRLSVTNSKLNPTDLVQLKELVQLESLDAMFTVYQEPSVWRKAQLGQMTPAERDWVSHFFSSHPTADPTPLRPMIEAAILTDRALARLGGLTRLRVLRLRNTNVTERCLDVLKDLPALEELDLNLLAFTPQAARVVGGMRSLRRFRYADVTDAELAEIARLSKLEELEVWASGVTDRGAESLARLTALRKLAIRGSRLTDQGLQRLAELPRLEELDVQHATGSLSAQGVKRFQEKKPGCKVLFGPPPEELFPFPPNDTDRVPRGSLPWANVSRGGATG